MNTEYAGKMAENQLKMTRQRKVIMTVLETSQGHHLTAEEIHQEVRKELPGVGLATVYRTLEMLARLEIIHKGSFDEGKHRYELYEKEGHFHHHFICLACGQIIEVRDDLLHVLENEMEKKGFRITDHRLKLYGYCPKCGQ
ncbi:MAG: Fur family transcriptional regulator [Acidobacteriota bacterium]